MATYCYRCPMCGWKVSHNARDELWCPQDGCDFLIRLVRDYRAEGVSTAIANLKREREFEALGDSTGGMASILPTHDDFKGPEDPDGKKGLRAWREEHEPRSPGHGDPIGDLVARDRLST